MAALVVSVSGSCVVVGLENITGVCVDFMVVVVGNCSDDVRVVGTAFGVDVVMLVVVVVIFVAIVGVVIVVVLWIVLSVVFIVVSVFS